MLRYKKGSHVGMILSFVIFLGFLIFLYTIIQPSLAIQEDKQILLENVKAELDEKFSSELTILTIVDEENVIEDCIELEDFMFEVPGANIVVKNKTGGFVNETMISSGQNNLQIKRYDSDNNFFKIYHSVEFDEVGIGSIVPCKIIKSDNYSIESITDRKEIFLQKINQTKIEYETDYEKLKTELGIPVGSEFGFSFTDEESILLETEQVNTSASVYVQESSILYVDEEVNINPGFLTIRVW